MFEVFNALWESSGLYMEPDLLTFKVLPGSTNFGWMEFVEGASSSSPPTNAFAQALIV